MASNINLPTALQNKVPLRQGFNLRKGSGQINTEVISGESLTRKRNIKVNDIISLSYHMTTTELNALDTFYTTTLSDGTKSFNMKHPVFNTQVEVKIIGSQEGGAFTFNNIGWDYYFVSLRLEVIG